MVRPRHWAALTFTYLPPLLPLAVWWDGLASTMRPYQSVELQRIVTSLPPAPYDWEIVELSGGPLPVLALMGATANRRFLKSGSQRQSWHMDQMTSP